jgi:hypothetical protein
MEERKNQKPEKKIAKKKREHPDWHPDHIQPPRTLFMSERHVTRMWKL